MSLYELLIKMFYDAAKLGTEFPEISLDACAFDRLEQELYDYTGAIKCNPHKFGTGVLQLSGPLGMTTIVRDDSSSQCIQSRKRLAKAETSCDDSWERNR